MEYLVDQFRFTCSVHSFPQVQTALQHGTQNLTVTLVFIGKSISKSISAHLSLVVIININIVHKNMPLTLESAVT